MKKEERQGGMKEEVYKGGTLGPYAAFIYLLF